MIRHFASLCFDLERAATDTVANSMVEAYCSSVAETDARIATELLHGKRIHRIISPRSLLQAVVEVTNTPAWLIEMSRVKTGTLVDTAALLLPPATAPRQETADTFATLFTLTKDTLINALLSSPSQERIILARLATGLRPSRYTFTPLSTTVTEERSHSMMATVLYVHQEGALGSARYSHITVATLRNGVLVPMARVSNTLTHQENQQLEHAATTKSVERFGPTTMLASGITVEIRYSEMVPSNRTKSGVRLVGASIVRIVEIS